ncbi:MAG: helix-turn-helix transcriptional regulator [Acidimicrobiales bacterium]
MTEFEFTLVIDGDLSQEKVARALFEAGCDDATFGVIDGMGYGEFLREAHSLADAVLSAFHQVESIGGLRILRVEPDDIVTMSDIADRLDRSRESVRLLIAGRRGPGGFPPPISHGMERGRLWRWSDVVSWFEQAGPEEIETAAFMAAINAALELRRHLPAMSDDLAVEELRGLM